MSLLKRSAWLWLFIGLGGPASAFAHDEDEKPAGPVKIEDVELYRPTAMPDRVVLTWKQDPATTQAVTWRTDATVTRGFAQIAVADAGPKFPETATTLPADTAFLDTETGVAHYHTAQFTRLQPKTKYAYRVGDGVNWTEWFQFTTASREPEPFSFVYFGDAQNNLRSMWSRVIREAIGDAPRARFFLHAGDLVNSGSRDTEWGEWHHAGGFLNAMIPNVPTPGNHEYPRATLPDTTPIRALTGHWRPQFALPENGPPSLEESCYWIDFQGARIISLNSNEQLPEQATWLERVLADSPAQWTIVTFHHPVFSTAEGRDNPELRTHWKPLFDKYKVDLVLTGHDHSYGRSGLDVPENLTVGAQVHEGGTVYVVSVSGPKMYQIDRRDFMQRMAEDTQLYQVVHVNGTQLRFEARTAVGELYDAFTLVKRPGQTNELIDEAPATAERRRAPEAEKKE